MIHAIIHDADLDVQDEYYCCCTRRHRTLFDLVLVTRTTTTYQYTKYTENRLQPRTKMMPILTLPTSEKKHLQQYQQLTTRVKGTHSFRIDVPPAHGAISREFGELLRIPHDSPSLRHSSPYLELARQLSVSLKSLPRHSFHPDFS